MFPNMSDRSIRATIKNYAGQALGWKLSGAGGGGYLVLVSESAIPQASRLKIRRAGL
jgi:mevalonate kinase